MKNLTRINVKAQNEFISVELKDHFVKQVSEKEMNELHVYAEKEMNVYDENGQITGVIEIFISLDLDNSVIEVYRKQILNEVPYTNLFTIDLEEICNRLSENGTYSLIMNDYVGYQIISALKSQGMEFKAKVYNDVETLSAWGETSNAVYSISLRETHKPEKVRINIFKYEERQAEIFEDDIKKQLANMMQDI